MIEKPQSMQANPILRGVTSITMGPILLFAWYVQWHGDYGPGGGFQAGVIFAAAVIAYALIYGLDRAQKFIPPKAAEIGVMAGWLLYIGTGVLNMFLGANFLDYDVLAHDPLHGQHYGILSIELGVGITVAAVMIVLFYAFAGRRRQ